MTLGPLSEGKAEKSTKMCFARVFPYEGVPPGHLMVPSALMLQLEVVPFTKVRHDSLPLKARPRLSRSSVPCTFNSADSFRVSPVPQPAGPPIKSVCLSELIWTDPSGRKYDESLPRVLIGTNLVLTQDRRTAKPVSHYSTESVSAAFLGTHRRFY
jgi:hypothetical protein